MKKARNWAVILIVSALLCILIDLLNIVIFPIPNLILLGLLPLLALAVLIYGIVFRRELFKKAGTIIAALFCIAAIVFCLVPKQKELDLVKYSAAKNSYHTAAQAVAAELLGTEDTTNGSFYAADIKLPFTQEKEVVYVKFGENLILNFPASRSFSAESGFVYLQGPDAYDYLEHPGLYVEGLSEDKIYEAYQVLDTPQWAYVEWVW